MNKEIQQALMVRSRLRNNFFKENTLHLAEKHTIKELLYKIDKRKQNYILSQFECKENRRQ